MTRVFECPKCGYRTLPQPIAVTGVSHRCTDLRERPLVVVEEQEAS